MSFPTYPKYRESGVDWLGKIPADWSVEKFRHRFRESQEKIEQGVVGPMLSVSGYRGIEVKDYDDENRRRTGEDLVGYRIVRVGQLVVNTMWLNYAGLGVSEHEGHVSPAYRSYSIDQRFDRRFVHHLMRSSVYVQGYTRLLTGVRPNSLQMSRDDLMAFPVLEPPFAEQKHIADFLDRETSKLDSLIAEQKCLIVLLTEKQNALIARAATGEGVGKTVRLGQLADVLPGYAFRSEDFSSEPDGVRLLRGINVGVGHCRWDDTFYWTRKVDQQVQLYALALGDLVFGMDRPWINEGTRVATVTADDLPALLVQRVARIRPRKNACSEYLRFILASREFQAHLEADLTGVSVPHISESQIASFPVPDMDKASQEKLSAQIKGGVDEASHLALEAERAIALLQERRAALISNAVTGQIDVRDVASAAA